MKNKTIKSFILISVFAFLIASISYGQNQYPGADDIVQEVNIKNDSDHRMVIAFTPGASAKINPHGTAVIRNPGGAKKKDFLKDGAKIYYGLDLTEKEKEESVDKYDDTQDVVWRNNGTQDYDFETESLEHKASVKLIFKYNPKDQKVMAVLSTES